MYPGALEKLVWKERREMERDGGREGEREGGREGEREGGREGEREGGREGGLGFDKCLFGGPFPYAHDLAYNLAILFSIMLCITRRIHGIVGPA